MLSGKMALKRGLSINIAHARLRIDNPLVEEAFRKTGVEWLGNHNLGTVSSSIQTDSLIEVAKSRVDVSVGMKVALAMVNLVKTMYGTRRLPCGDLCECVCDVVCIALMQTSYDLGPRSM